MLPLLLAVRNRSPVDGKIAVSSSTTLKLFTNIFVKITLEENRLETYAFNASGKDATSHQLLKDITSQVT